MILYFSATGNSAYVAKRIGKELEDETLDLFHKIRSHDHSEIISNKPWVIVTPTYAWRIPRIIQEWLSKVKLSGNKDIYFVMTCGDSSGNAGGYAEKLCVTLGIHFMGCMTILMPENYIALFAAPTQDKALEIINKAETKIEKAALLIKSKKKYPQPAPTFKDKLCSGFVNQIFYPLFVHAKKFYVTDACISCGKCEKSCPMSNIRMENKKPVWENQCTHCMACICRCPEEAIEYGKSSKGKVRYVCPKRI